MLHDIQILTQLYNYLNAPETSKLVKNCLFNNDVKLKLSIDKVEFVDKLFKSDKVELPVKEFIIFINDDDNKFKFDVDVLKIFV